MCRITGYAGDELIGQTPRMLQGECSDRTTLNRLKGELSAGRACLVELINYRKDRTPYAAEVFISPLLAADGRRTNFVSIHRDITERKRQERVVYESEERLRAVLNTAADAIITIDHRGIITSVNSSTEQMFGYTHDELVGQNVSILMPPPYCDEHDGYIARFLETGEARVIGIGRELVALHKDGSTFPIGLAVSQVDHLGLFTGVIRDISALKELQKQILEIAAEEDRKIGHELHDNVQQQLTGLGLLAANLSDVLQKKSTPEAPLAAKVAEGIKQSANDVHLLSRGLVPVEVDAEGLRAALTDLAVRISDQYDVSCDFRSDGSIGVSDNFTATHLFRIAQEAVNNSIKHGRANSIEISLAGADKLLTLKVLDDGIGLGDKRVPGPGMGLRIMDYRAGLIGATLQIASRENGGTSVNCTVPK
jgi:PAS domain S-box-containing protein